MDDLKYFQSLFQNRFTIQQVLGKGAFATVFSCYDKLRHSYNALKVTDLKNFHQEQKAILCNEYNLVKSFDCPNILKVLEVEEINGYYIQIMELCEGGTLDDYMKRRNKLNKPLTEEEVKGIMNQVFRAVDYCHSKFGILHRDIKPDNLLLKSYNSLHCIKLADFGLSVNNNSFGMPKNLTGGAGTPIYMAPEILLEKEYGTRVDVWACGIVMWNL